MAYAETREVRHFRASGSNAGVIHLDGGVGVLQALERRQCR